MSDGENSIAKAVLGNPWVKALGALLALGLIAFVLYGLSFVLAPLLMAFIVAYIFDPLVDQFEKRKVSRGVTIGALAGLGFAGLLAFFIYVPDYAKDQAIALQQSAQAAATRTDKGGWQAWLEQQAERLPVDEIVDQTGWRGEYMEAIGEGDAYRTYLDELTRLEVQAPLAEADAAAEEAESQTAAPAGEEGEPKTPEPDRRSELRSLIEAAAPSNVVVGWKIGEYIKLNLRSILTQYGGRFTAAGQDAGASIASLFKTIGGTTVSVVVFLGNLAIFSIVAGYLLKDYDGVVAAIGSLVPPKSRPPVFRIMGKIDLQLRSFLVGQLTVCAVLAVMYAIGLGLSGVPFWFFIALFGGFATLIPFFGVMLTFIPAAVLTIVNYGFDVHIIYVVLTFVVVQLLEGNVVTPMVVGTKVGLHPVWVILAVMVFGSLLGFAGLLIAVPLAAILKVLVTEAVAYYRRSPLFADEHPDSA